MTSIAASLQEFIKALEANRSNTYSFVAALTFCSYDIILSFGEEAKYIWGSRWSTVKVLYFIVRYYSLVYLITLVGIYTSVNVSVPVCQQYFLWSINGGSPVFIIALDGILLLRVVALYKQDKRVFVVLLILVLGDFAAVLWATIRMSRYLAANIIVIPPPWQGCAAALPKSKFILATYILNSTVSSLFLVMTVWKLLENHRWGSQGKLTWRTLYDMGNVSPLLLAFMRDGSIFFAIASVGSFLAIIALFMVQGPIQASFLPWIFALYSYSGAHLILDLRAAGRRGNCWNETMSLQYGPDGFDRSIRFASLSGDWE